MTTNRTVFFEELPGGRVLARPPDFPQFCECWPGKVWFDTKTNRKVGYQQFFFDVDERVYFLNGKRLTAQQAEKIDRASTPEHWIDPRYIGSDGLIRGARSGYEWCDICERRKKARMGGWWLRLWLASPSGRRSYWFEFDPSCPPYLLTAFIRAKELWGLGSAKQRRELIVWSLLYFRRYSCLPNCTERSLARRFHITRGKIRSIRLRFQRLLKKSAVQKKP